jgi:cation transport ATPase
MGLATPVAVWGGLARLARLGIVARSGDFLDALARVDTVCFDKTGTLSEERLTVLGWEIEPAWREREAELKAVVAAVERGVAHPVARALAETASCNPMGYTVTDLVVVAGCGVEAEVAGWGRVRVGEREFCGGGDGVEAEAGKWVWVAVESVIAGRVCLGETWRAGLVETVSELGKLGLEMEILTGDAAAGENGRCNLMGYTMPVRAGLTPGGKLERVRALSGEGRRVLFAGDGVNDAAAMGAASASLALRGGSELARAAAMAVCAGDDLRRLPEAVRVARRVRAGVRGNLRFAATYNAVGMALAAAGVLHPVAAALLMVGSSVWVGVRAVRSAEAAV